MDMYEGMTFIDDEHGPHLGGNVREGDPYTYSPTTWDYVVRRFAVSSVLDLGSGMGFASEYFFRQGLRVIAVDGAAENIRNAVYPTLQIDITRGSVVCEVDLVHCQEVVEHVAEAYLENLLDCLCNGKFLLMSHALPRQYGHHHVNLQPKEYWVAHLDRRGFNYLVEDSRRIRELARQDGAIYLANSGLVFARRHAA
jgi:SAM-dependent methyltransferase